VDEELMDIVDKVIYSENQNEAYAALSKRDQKSFDVFKEASIAAATNGSTYFVFDRNSTTMSACCRLRTTVEDNYMIKHPESMRFCGFQNVTINMPQASYRAGENNFEGLKEETRNMMKLAVQAHLEKKKFVEKLQVEGGPQWQTGKIAPDGFKYIDLDKSTYIIGLIGLNETMQHQLGEELHTMSEEQFREYALGYIADMNVCAQELSKEHGLKIVLEESPAESTSRRFAKIDLIKYPKEAAAVVRGDIKEDRPFYSNSIHIRADAQVDFPTRVQVQSMFHGAIDAGAMIHDFVGEKLPAVNTIMKNVSKTYRNTQAAQTTISPEFTGCVNGHRSKGFHENCPECGSTDVKKVVRIVGYYAEEPLFNESKKEEHRDRQKGVYDLDVVIKSPLNDYKIAAKDGIEVNVFGKEGCDFCERLMKRTEGVLKKEFPENSRKLIYHDMTKTDGLREAMWNKVNPSKIPTMVITDTEGVRAKLEPDYESKDPDKQIILPKHFRPYLA
ncbi:anaerobic ribonucleoside-triphosphate reductase, partial [Candidatus Woesearchaeota archaeon]|nr:anaerobic ribonucleoside-triphosphate reductase [Candidatus Woesearchaeota archaeon]